MKNEKTRLISIESQPKKLIIVVVIFVGLVIVGGAVVVEFRSLVEFLEREWMHNWFDNI